MFILEEILVVALYYGSAKRTLLIYLKKKGMFIFYLNVIQPLFLGKARYRDNDSIYRTWMYKSTITWKIEIN